MVLVVKRLENNMQRLIEYIKNINIKQIFVVSLASCLLIVTTACSQGDVAQGGTGSRGTSKTYQGDLRDTYDDYDANQNYEGGMNGYDDDRRYDSGTAAKAKSLVDTAKRRQADDLGEFVDNVGDRAINEKTTDRALGKFSDKLERNKDKAETYIDNKSDKLQRNLEKASGGAKDVFEGAVDTAGDAIDDAAKASRKTTKNIKGNFEDLGEDLS